LRGTGALEHGCTPNSTNEWVGFGVGQPVRLLLLCWEGSVSSFVFFSKSSYNTLSREINWILGMGKYKEIRQVGQRRAPGRRN
jgi:hypothetical protein